MNGQGIAHARTWVATAVIVTVFSSLDIPRHAHAVETDSVISVGPARPTDSTQLPHELETDRSEQAEQSSAELLKTAGATVVGDVKYLLTAPLRMDMQSGLITAGVVGVVGGVMVFDSNIQKWVQKRRTDEGNNIFKQISKASDAAFPLTAGLAVGGYLFRTNEEGNKLFQTSLVSLEAQGLSGGLAHVFKIVAGRKRPADDPQGNSYSPGLFGSSFPSGHASNLFAMAAVFSEQYPMPVQLFLYSVATAVSAERVYSNHHFTSDVLAGAVIGYVVGKALAWRHTYGDKGLSFMPLDVAGGVGVTLQYRF